MKYNIAIVDDHKIFRDGLKMVLDSMTKLVGEVSEAANGRDFLELLKTQHIDLAFMDISMPVMDGVEASRKAVKTNPNLKIIAITSFDYIEYVNNMLAVGVEGYLLKDADYDEIELSIQHVMDGKTYFSKQIMEKLTQSTLNERKKSEQRSVLPKLTRRESEILKLICKGVSKRQIAEQLFISERTVEKHKENIMIKTNTNNAVSLILFALKHKLAKL